MLMPTASTPATRISFLLDNFASVKGTPFDFTTSTKVGARIVMATTRWPRPRYTTIGSATGKRRLDPCCARLRTHQRTFDEVSTTSSGRAVLTGNFSRWQLLLDKKGPYTSTAKRALPETQHFPDSPESRISASTILKPGETFR